MNHVLHGKLQISLLLGNELNLTLLIYISILVIQ